jgi:transposase
MRLRDPLGTIVEDHEVADLFPRRGQPAQAPWRLAVVCLVQYIEELTDRQAADAVRSPMDRKYWLGLDLSAPGFDFRVLCAFGSRLVDHQAEHRLFELLGAKLREQGYLKKRGPQRTDSTHVSGRRASRPSGRTAPGTAASCPECSSRSTLLNGCTNGHPWTGSHQRRVASKRRGSHSRKKHQKPFWNRLGQTAHTSCRGSLSKRLLLCSLICPRCKSCDRFGFSTLFGKTGICTCETQICFPPLT